MLVSQKDTVTFANKYEICELSEYEQRKAAPPFAQFVTCVEAAYYGRLKDLYRKDRRPSVAVCFAIAAVVIGYGIYLGNTPENENKAYFAVLAATVPLGFAIVLLIKSYIASGRLMVRLYTSDGSDGHMECAYAFYDNEFIYCDIAHPTSMFTQPVTVIPCGCIRKLLITDDAVVLADKDDIGFFMMRKDIPPQFEQNMQELFSDTAVIDRRTV